MASRSLFHRFLLPVFATTAVGAFAACGATGAPAPRSSQAPASVRTETSPPSDKSGNAIQEFAQSVSRAPYFATSDYSGPSETSFALGASGLVRGTVVAVERGPDMDGSLSAVIDGAPRTDPLLQLTLAFQVRVISVEGAVASTIAPSEVVRLIVPIWRGPEEFADKAAATYVTPLVDSAPDAMDLLAAVAQPRTSDTIEPFGIASVLIANADGRFATNLTAPSDTGTVWGSSELAQIEKSVAASLR